ncbi:RTA1 like protein [Aspergillus steynii IBT 23096]|uniref:RTA1 like protein n=1 Tax=Aspergillus steynii IBT 23096 TaxID=1392250 RepID=A0A2I2G766_9EURO|nr:RTA1 like protein [Aspergillus steynii IBT 23096]PLB48729.1 RTA1 like protein [Aspergillus steynii IBT 23096]
MPLPENYNYYHFHPNKVIGIVATALYGTSAIFHIVQLWRARAWYFLSLLTGAFMMTLGYIFRVMGAEDPTAFGPFVAQSICIVLPPAFYAATIYMTYGRIVNHVGRDDLSLVSARKVTKIFLWGDITAIIGQSTGGGLTPNGGSLAKVGDGITVAGLFVQLVFFGFFLVVTIIFERRMHAEAFKRPYPKWLVLIWVLFFVSALIIIRCIFRIIEYIQGADGYLATHEVYLYVFDTLPMFVVQVIFHFWYPGDILTPREPQGIPLTSQGTGSDETA